MKVLIKNNVMDGWVEVHKPDSDGDVFLNTDGRCYLNVASVRRLIRALQWAIQPPKRRKTRA